MHDHDHCSSFIITTIIIHPWDDHDDDDDDNDGDDVDHYDNDGDDDNDGNDADDDEEGDYDNEDDDGGDDYAYYYFSAFSLLLFSLFVRWRAIDPVWAHTAGTKRGICSFKPFFGASPT